MKKESEFSLQDCQESSFSVVRSIQDTQVQAAIIREVSRLQGINRRQKLGHFPFGNCCRNGGIAL
jgi:hypothetical protein